MCLARYFLRGTIQTYLALLVAVTVIYTSQSRVLSIDCIYDFYTPLITTYDYFFKPNLQICVSKRNAVNSVQGGT
jgi:hypothetical protein